MISLNAVFNKPTRDEKERKAARGQATVDRISEMSLADELTKNQMRYAKELGIEFDDKAYQREKEKELGVLKEAGDANPTETRAKAKTEGIYKAANAAVKFISGGLLGLPKKEAEKDVAKADEEAAVSTLGRKKAEAYIPYQGTLADTEVGRLVSGNVKEWNANDRAIELGPLSGQAEAAGLAAKRDEARNYVGQFEQRKLENEIGLLQAQMRQEYLNNLQKDPLQLNLMVNPKLQPADFGRGIAPQYLMDSPMAPLGQTNAPAMQRPKAAGPQTDIERLRAIVEGLPRPAQPKLQD